MRGSNVLIAATACGAVVCSLLLLDGRAKQAGAAAALAPCREIVRQWQLSDLCLFTEARYTRHPAMADLHGAFQDHPVALEHFPTGSLVPPPRLRPGDR